MHKLLLAGLLGLALIACKKEEKPFSGYIDADLIYLSADYSGRLLDLPVHRGQLVQTNQFMFRLEQNSERYNKDISQLNTEDLLNQREQILTQLNYNKINYRRIVEMRQRNAASQNDLDMAQRDLDLSQKQLADIGIKIKSSQTDTADKKWILSRKENFAPAQGIIFDTYYTQGEFVQAGYPILSLITHNKIKAIFFIPEEDLSKVRLNHRVQIKTTHNANLAAGHISYISNIAEYTPPIIYSREEREKLIFRVEAQIDSPDLEQIHLGQPISLELVS